MKAKKPTEKTTRKRYSDESKDQALKRADREGVAMVAQDLGIAKTQMYA
jgi:transposase-like protein